MSIDNKINRHKTLLTAIKTIDSGKSLSFRARESDDMTMAGGRHTQFVMEDISITLRDAIKAEVMREMELLRKDICDSAHSVYVRYSDTGAPEPSAGGEA